MILATLLFSIQLNPFVEVDLVVGDKPKVPIKGAIFTVDLKIVARRGVVLLDTKRRAMPFQFEYTADKSLLSYAVKGVGKSGSHIFANPEEGIFVWANVLDIRNP